MTMEWDEVFTTKQKEKLIASVAKELETFLKWASDRKFIEEVEISASYGFCGKLVLRESVLMERKYHSCNVEKVYVDIAGVKVKNVYYNSIEVDNYPAIVERHKVDVKLLNAVRAKIEALQNKVSVQQNEYVQALEELRNLVRSSELKYLIRDIQLFAPPLGLGNKLILTKRGLEEVGWIGESSQLVAEKDWPAVVFKYHLTVSYLLGWRKKIEH